MLDGQEKALRIRDEILEAIDRLMKAIHISKSYENAEYDNDNLIKIIGILVGEIDTRLLSIIYSSYPELDDLKIKGIFVSNSKR